MGECWRVCDISYEWKVFTIVFFLARIAFWAILLSKDHVFSQRCMNDSQEVYLIGSRYLQVEQYN